jgi:hypothetical protein
MTPERAPSGSGLRRVFCENYSICLAVAVNAAWTGFSCASCAQYQQEYFDAGRVEDQGMRCRTLWLAARNPGKAKGFMLWGHCSEKK